MKQRIKQKLIRLAHEECGSELVEFAMTALVLMGLLFGTIQFALAMYAYHFVSSAAQQGVRFAVVRGATWSKDETAKCSSSASNFTIPYDCEARPVDIQNYVQSLTTLGINSSNVTIDETNVWPGTTPDGAACSPVNSQGCLVKVKVSYTFNFLKHVYFPLKVPSMSMSATSEGVILQ